MKLSGTKDVSIRSSLGGMSIISSQFKMSYYSYSRLVSCCKERRRPGLTLWMFRCSLPSNLEDMHLGDLRQTENFSPGGFHLGTRIHQYGFAGALS